MTFEAALKTVAAEIDSVLDRLLPSEDAPAKRLADAMRYAALAPGKRLRPFLVVESSSLFGVDRARSLRVGAALECVHCYSLVHDDLPVMDDDDLRRGRPTAHKAFDEATAILAGDALLTLAFEILGGADTHPDPALRLDLVVELAKASGARGMVGGQMLDIAAETAAAHGLDNTLLMQSLKTGALFRFACEAGAILGRASPEARRALRQYAERIGLAFQIADDILDVESPAWALGKASQKDKTLRKATFVGLLGLAAAKAKAAGLAEDAIAALAAFGDSADLLRQAVRFAIARRQ